MSNIVRSNDKINQMINTGKLAQYGGFKNYIINGGFDIWQRGTNGGANDGYADADRFITAKVLSRGKSDATTYPLGFSSAYKITKNNTQDSQIIQRVEFPKDKIKTITNGRTFTFSAWVLSDVTNVIENIYIIKQGTSSNAYEARSNTSGFVNSLDIGNSANIWKRISMTFTFDWGYEAGDCIEVRIDPANNVAATLHTTGWQLEEGSVATPFEHRPYGLELSLCQRYYWKPAYMRFALPVAYNGSTAENWGSFFYTTTMRTTPSLINTGYAFIGHHADIPTIAIYPNHLDAAYNGSSFRSNGGTLVINGGALDAEL